MWKVTFSQLEKMFTNSITGQESDYWPWQGVGWKGSPADTVERLSSDKYDENLLKIMKKIF